LKEQLELLPRLLLSHVRLVFIAMLVSVVTSIPLGVLATRSARFERVVVGLASVVQTIPALALLAVMVPVLGAMGLPAIGVLPALIGLSLYCALPILVATVTGVREVSPALVEAARAVGMRDREVLRLVELPLAAPFIVAGIRTATVWCVGMATLSTPIGAPSLGNYIFGGLQTRNHAATLVGCAAAATLALALDVVVRLIETGLKERRRTKTAVGVLALATVLVGALGSLGLEAATSRRGDTVRIGTKSFTEQYILGRVLSQTVESKTGKKTELVESLGSSVVFDALADGTLDVYVDYTGTVWTTVLKRTEGVPSREEALRDIESELANRYGVEVVASLGFENTYALAIRKEDAEKWNVRTLSELSARAPDLRLGADYELFTRKEWTDLQRAYGYRFKEQRSMDPALMYQAARQGEVDVICAFSTDGRLASYRLAVLEDDKKVFPPFEAIILASKKLATRHPDVLEALRSLGGSLDEASMREMNRSVDEDHASPSDVARRFLLGR